MTAVARGNYVAPRTLMSRSLDSSVAVLAFRKVRAP